MKDQIPIKHIHLLKNYTAQYHKNHFVLNSENQQEIGRITDETKLFILHQCIEYQSQVYEIKNVGFMKNDVELSLAKRIIYFISHFCWFPAITFITRRDTAQVACIVVELRSRIYDVTSVR